MNIEINDMPKLQAPYVRIGEHYVVTPEIVDEYRWIFSSDCVAVDKLDGTNVSVIMDNGHIRSVFNRMNFIQPWTGGSLRYTEGLAAAHERGYMATMQAKDGQYFGELIGPGIQGNPYQLKSCLWVPFEHLRRKYHYKFWPKFVEETKNMSEEERFNALSDLFKGLWSIYKRSINLPGDIKEITEHTGFTGLAAEGIVFYNIKTGAMCKLRRDMFIWHTQPRHKEE